MPDFCAAYGCSNHRSLETRTRGITFHVFPKTKERRRQWELALRRDGFVSCDRTLLCSEHFRSEEFDRTGQTVRLKDGVVPTIFNFPAHLQRPEATRSTTTSRRAEDEPQPNVMSILNVTKTREMVIDFRRVRTSPLPLCILGEDVAVVEDYKYLGNATIERHGSPDSCPTGELSHGGLRTETEFGAPWDKCGAAEDTTDPPQMLHHSSGGMSSMVSSAILTPSDATPSARYWSIGYISHVE
nr:THAP domain-containing protein 1-like [Pseudochaenichthys georgianus]